MPKRVFLVLSLLATVAACAPQRLYDLPNNPNFAPPVPGAGENPAERGAVIAPGGDVVAKPLPPPTVVTAPDR